VPLRKVTVRVLAILGPEGAATKMLMEILAVTKLSQISTLMQHATFLIDRVSVKYCTTSPVFQLKLTLPEECTLAIPDVQELVVTS